MLKLIEVLLAIYFGYVSLYTLIFSLSGLFYKLRLTKEGANNKIAVFIPGYKEDSIIVNTAKSALKQHYPKNKYDIIIIADSFDTNTLKQLALLDIIVLPVSFEKSTKTKSLNEALSRFSGYDIAVILDSDNLMQNDFLEKINAAFNQGFEAIQGQRIAKNLNTSYAILDGISEAIGNHISRQGPYALGLSSSIIGSAMAFKFDLLKKSLLNIDAVGGFDKALQVNILEAGQKIHYLKEAIVLDEKVDSKEVFKNQRTRWISSHYKYLFHYAKTGFSAIFKNFSLFNITILAQIQLPRILNLGLISTIGLLSIYGLSFFPKFWIITCTIYIMSTLICIPKSYLNLDTLKALITLPLTFFTVILIHLRLKGKDNNFIHTPHKH